jgi:hypothetical protein
MLNLLTLFILAFWSENEASDLWNASSRKKLM